MKPQVTKVHNLHGLPYINREVADVLKLKGYTILVGVERLFSKAFKPEANAAGIIIIDQVGKLTAAGIPLLGYVRGPNGLLHRVPVDPRRIVANTVTVTSPVFVSVPEALSLTNGAAPSLKLLLEYHEAKTHKQLKKLAGKYEQEIEKPESRKFKWLRRAVRDNLKLHEPIKEKASESADE